MNDFDPQAAGMRRTAAVRAGRRSILAAPLPVGAGTQVVLELFDKPAGSPTTTAGWWPPPPTSGRELLRQALAERQTHRLLFDAVAGGADAARRGADAGLRRRRGRRSRRRRRCWNGSGRGWPPTPNAVIDADTALRLVEAVRVLAVRHGPSAVEHCMRGRRPARTARRHDRNGVRGFTAEAQSTRSDTESRTDPSSSRRLRLRIL